MDYTRKELFSIRHAIKDMDSQEKKRFRHLLDTKKHTEHEKKFIDSKWRGFWDTYYYDRKSSLDEFGYLGF